MQRNLFRFDFLFPLNFNPFFTDAFVCEEWTETEFCSDRCSNSGTKLETRVCAPIQPSLLFLIKDVALIRPGNTTCENVANCTGHNCYNLSIKFVTITCITKKHIADEGEGRSNL